MSHLPAQSNLDAVVHYIQTQEAHHREMMFEQEFHRLAN